MKKIFFTLLAFTCFMTSNFAVNQQNWKQKVQTEVDGITPDMVNGMDMNTFLEFTPAKYKQKTGKKLGLVKTMQLKAAQKFLKKRMNSEDGSSSDIPEGLYIVMAIFALGWIAMGIMDDFSGRNWWVNLLLSICIIPGIIHAFIKKNEYY